VGALRVYLILWHAMIERQSKRPCVKP